MTKSTEESDVEKRKKEAARFGKLSKRRLASIASGIITKASGKRRGQKPRWMWGD